jgi:hypothetical protein
MNILQWIGVIGLAVLIGIAFKKIGLAVTENIPRKLKEISNQLEHLHSKVSEIEKNIKR